MAAHRKKIVVSLAAFVLAATVMVRLAHPAGEPPVSKSSEFGTRSLLSNDPNFSTAGDENAGTGELFYRMLLMVLLVVVLGAAAIYISRRFLPRIGNLAGKRIKVIETAYLGPRKAVHLLKVDDRFILVGSTNEHIAKLADIDDAARDLPVEYGAID